MAGIRTPDLQEKTTLDDFIGNKDSGAGSETVRVSAAAAAAQLRTLIQFNSAVVAVITKTLSAPPGGEAIGDRYIVKPTGTGAFAGKDNNVATKTADGWSFVAPSNGYRAFLIDEKADYFWDATASKWTVIDAAAFLFATEAERDAVTGAPANLEAHVISDIVGYTASRARTSNVATIVMQAAHSLTTGKKVNVRSLGGSGYNANQVSVTVTNTTTFTYPSTGGNESTTADTAGQVDRNGASASDGAGAWVWKGDIDVTTLGTRVASLETTVTTIEVSAPVAVARAPFEFAMVDTAGWAYEFGPKQHGYQYSFNLGDCETIVTGIDSRLDASYVLRDKSWAAILGGLSPYRVQQLGISGFRMSAWYKFFQRNYVQAVEPSGPKTYDAKGMQAWSGRQAKLAIMLSWTNEGLDTSGDVGIGYPRHARKLAEMFRSFGAEIAFLSEFRSTDYSQHTVMTNLAREIGADMIDVRGYFDEIQWASGPDTDSVHPATRTSAVYLAPVLKWLRRQPRPDRSIKHYHTRGFVDTSSLANLVFDGTSNTLFALYKEISISHSYFNPADGTTELFEEMSKHVFFGTMFNVQRDEYQNLQTGGSVAGTEYMLTRISVPAEARGLEGVAVKMSGDATAYYVLDFFGNNTVDTDTPPGVWTQITPVNGVLPLDRRLLPRIMQHNELFILSYKSGGQTMRGATVYYTPKPGHRVTPKLVRDVKVNTLLAQWDGSTLTGWTATGSPAVVVPWDRAFGIPRAVGSTAAISAVLVLNTGDKVKQTISLTAPVGTERTIIARVWCRYGPKAYLDNTLFTPAFDTAQIVQRSGSTSVAVDSPINFESVDRVRLKANISGVKTAGSVSWGVVARQTQWAELYWSPVDFTISLLAGSLPGTMTLEFEALDNNIQIARVDLFDGVENVYRA